MIKTAINHYIMDKFISSCLDGLVDTFIGSSERKFSVGEYYSYIIDHTCQLSFVGCVVTTNAFTPSAIPSDDEVLLYVPDNFICRFSYQSVLNTEDGSIADERIYADEEYNRWDISENDIDEFELVQ